MLIPILLRGIISSVIPRNPPIMAPCFVPGIIGIVKKLTKKKEEPQVDRRSFDIEIVLNKLNVFKLLLKLIKLKKRRGKPTTIRIYLD